MKKYRISEKNILIYRIVITGLSLFTFITGAIISTIGDLSILPWFNSFITYTRQTNLMVIIWFILAIILRNKPKYLKKITGALKGAFTLYMTILFTIFAVLLQFFYPLPTGWAAFSNLVIHYIIPIAFIIDWLLTEQNIKYKWSYLLVWIIYPIGYMIYAVIYSAITGSYIYYFFDINGSWVMYFSILFIYGLILACILIAINRRRTKD